MLRKQDGMTLIEIMIVIAIIGGLMATLGTTVFSNFSKARVKQAKIQMQELTKSLELYATDCGSFPSEGKGLGALIEDPGECDNWGPEPYAKAKMLKDPWNNEFEYVRDGSSFILTSFGADGKEGGSGNDKDISSADF